VSIEIVKLQARKTKSGNVQYLLTAPREIVEDVLKWSKGDKLIARAIEIEIDGVKKKALVYHKP